MRRFAQATGSLIFACAIGAFGMLLGSVADFGAHAALSGMASVCTTSSNDSLLSGTVRMIQVAPWSHVGMLLGCSVGIAIAESWSETHHNKVMSCSRHLACIVGMMAGMWSIGMANPEWSVLHTIGPVVLMMMGMMLGMTVPLLVFDLFGRPDSQGTVDRVSQHIPRAPLARSA